MDNRDETQAEKFVHAARQRDSDEDEETFKARLRKIAKAQVKGEPPELPVGAVEPKPEK